MYQQLVSTATYPSVSGDTTPALPIHRIEVKKELAGDIIHHSIRVLNPRHDDNLLRSCTGIPGDMLRTMALSLDTDEYTMGRPIIVSLRPVEPAARKYLEKGHPTKNFHIKGKSSDFGPHAGLIPANQSFSKLKSRGSSNDRTKSQSNVDGCIREGYATKVHLELPREEVRDFVNSSGGRFDESNKPLEATANGETYLFKPTREGNNPASYTVFFRDHEGEDKPLEVLAYPVHQNNTVSLREYDLIVHFLEKDAVISDIKETTGKDIRTFFSDTWQHAYLVRGDTETRILTLSKHGNRGTIDADFVGLLKEIAGNNDEVTLNNDEVKIGADYIRLIPCMDPRPMTADLDLFSIYSHPTSDEQHEDRKPLCSQSSLPPLGQAPSPLTREVVGKTESVTNGNMTKEAAIIGRIINKDQNMAVINHSAEVNNPISGRMEDNLPLLLVLNKPARKVLAELCDIPELQSFRQQFSNSEDTVLLIGGDGITTEQAQKALSHLTSLLTQANVLCSWRNTVRPEDTPHFPETGIPSGEGRISFGSLSSDMTDASRMSD